ncbi:hypothetical protein [Microbacterium sp. 13-71-7]|jgi:predicted negative regulator of RcsB-dependent stress response|uniref:hypothetical protein n=1 Tax=Microbacterium sp. 13-71-7 TaxID=1970399 RepID=UPI0025CBE9F5|nr:hypothetical protein [Microbacterium sp. 13-71-7]
MDILETILRWIVHAAIFRAMWALGWPWIAVVGVVALLGWIGWRVVSRRRRHG